MLNKLRNNQGFTLIELLIVVAIIGILAAIAIPQFSKYRMQGYNASATSDLTNLRTSEESLYAEWQHYGKTDNTAAVPGPGGFGAGLAIAGPGPAAPNVNMITTSDSVGTARGLQVAIGNNITAQVTTDVIAGPPATGGSSYTAIVKHLQGDTVYAADSDSTANYKNSTLVAAGTPITAATNTFAPAAGDQIQGTAGWSAM